MNLNKIEVVYVVIDDDTRQRRGLYVGGELEAVGKDAARQSMTLLWELGWTGPYEQVFLTGIYSYEFCEDYADMPDTLDEVLLCGGVENGFRQFPAELD